jgi:hypothetical protein
MPYKISGALNDSARILILKESDWSIESNTEESVGDYEIESLVSGTKTVLALKSDGEVLGYGGISPEEYSSGGDRGVFGGGNGPTNVMDYITISTPGNATDFGDLTVARYDLAACSNSTRGLFGGGYTSSDRVNVMDYITISTPGNATDFGDLTMDRSFLAACSNSTRGVFGSGWTGSLTNVMDYITISTPGDATDFGDLTVARYDLAACSDCHGGLS